MRIAKYIVTLFLFVLYSFVLNGQSNVIDSLKIVLQTQKEDTNKVNTLNAISYALLSTNNQNSLPYANQALSLAEKLNFKDGAGDAYVTIGFSYLYRNDDTTGIKNILNGIRVFEELNMNLKIADTYYNLAGFYSFRRNYGESLNYAFAALKIYESAGNKFSISETLSTIAATYIEQNNLNDALKYLERSMNLYVELGNRRQIAECLNTMGDVFYKKRDYKMALNKYIDAQKYFEEINDKWWIAWSYQSEGQVYEAMGSHILRIDDKEANQNLNLALKNYTEALKIFSVLEDIYGTSASNIAIGSVQVKLKNLGDAYKNLEEGLRLAIKFEFKEHIKNGYGIYAALDSSRGNFKQAFEHYKKYILYRDSIFNEESSRKSLQSKMQYEFDKKEAAATLAQMEAEKEQERKRVGQWRVIASLGLLILVFLLIMFFQWRNSKHRKQANLLLQQQKEKVESTLSELRSTQSQLIQSEKMASLGELTAGIAHEIQNPLNFVNNFSDVNTELVDEAKLEMDKGNVDEVKSILNDIKDNEQKINHHGKRADAIVKGMLQHSRASSGQKESTDINALTDEYLRLAYHGLRAKDKSFNATTKTDFDNSIEKINIIPQDIGRVILNLINNAFYAVTEKKKVNTNGYEPVVTVTTKKDNSKIEIKVRDNGNGIPQKNLDRIFQPFFTTKPTGQGTGLGLSLAYDIVTKGHGGELKVETREGEGSEFIIQLPVSKATES